MTEFQRIVRDNRTWSAIDSLIHKGKCGIQEDEIIPFLIHIASLPDLWLEWNRETPEQREQRRRVLAHKMRDLARLIDEDRQAKHYYFQGCHDGTIIKLGGVVPVKSPGATLSEILQTSANELQKNTGLDVYNDFIKNRRRSNATDDAGDLRSFVIRDISIRAYSYVWPDYDAPIDAVFNLVNAVLCNEFIDKENIREAYKHLFKSGGIMRHATS